MRRVIKHAEDNPILWVMAAFITAVIAIFLVVFVAYAPDPVQPPKQMGLTGKKLHASEESMKQLVKFLHKEEILVAVAIVRADLIKNERSTLFFTSDNDDLQKVWTNYLTLRLPPPAVFSGKPYEKFNDRVTDLLNGKFDCRRFKASIGYTRYPDADKYAPWLCSISVPPGTDASGDFVGYLNLFMSREPNAEDKKRISAEVAVIATDIYRRDVK